MFCVLPCTSQDSINCSDTCNREPLNTASICLNLVFLCVRHCISSILISHIIKKPDTFLNQGFSIFFSILTQIPRLLVFRCSPLLNLLNILFNRLTGGRPLHPHSRFTLAITIPVDCPRRETENNHADRIGRVAPDSVNRVGFHLKVMRTSFSNKGIEIPPRINLDGVLHS